jgi:hypothetical protein
MSEGVASPRILRHFERTRAPVPEKCLAIEDAHLARGWNPDEFSREQIRGLVRQVFFSNAVQPVRQVVFSALDVETDVRHLCRNVGEVLARETSDSVAVVGRCPWEVSQTNREDATATKNGKMPLHCVGIRVNGNLWLVPGAANGSDCPSSNSLNSYLGEVRREFEFSIVQSPPAAESDVATAMGQFADGVILVLSAERTRRAVARQVKDALQAGRVRILGTVLTDRQFPIPEGIYRRL